MHKITTLIIATLLLAVPVVHAQAEPARFFVAASDVPIMDGLVEDQQAGFVYDSPQGRVIESVAILHQVSEEDVRRFFNESLPVFGWAFSGADEFVRGKEILSIRIDTHRDQKVLTLSIAPRS